MPSRSTTARSTSPSRPSTETQPETTEISSTKGARGENRGFAGREGGRGEAGAVAEEAAEVRGIGEAEVHGHGTGIPLGASQQAPGFEEAPLVDEFTYSLAGGVLGGAAEGADRATEQLGVVRGLVEFAEVQLQGVQEAPVPVGAARVGRGRAAGGDAGGVG